MKTIYRDNDVGSLTRRIDTLTERLAQAERKAEQQMALANKLERELEQAERERDEWQSKAQHWETVAGGISREAKRTVADRDEWKMRCEVGADQMRVERDAALARYEQAQQDANRALAKAEAAEKRLHDVFLEPKVREALDWRDKLISERGFVLLDLRAQIAALADKWEHGSGGLVSAHLAPQLRALLTPPKAETALDVLSRIEKGLRSVDYENGTFTGDMAKLRKLLTEQEGK